MKTAIDIVLALIRSSKSIADVISTLAGQDTATVEARLERARAAIKDPISTDAEDKAHRSELDAILRGDGDGSGR